MSEARPRVSVVIPLWNGGPRFVHLLEVLRAQELEGGFELVVVDSGSSDGSAEAAREAADVFHTIPQSEFNHGGTRNLGISLSAGEVVCLLTQDAVPMHADYLACITAPFADERVDGAYARQFPLDDCDPILKERLRGWSASRNEPVLQHFALGDAAAARAAFDALPPMERYLACAYDNVASAMRRSSWERHPYPERNFGEDVAWARKVLLDGGAVHFEPTARVEHSHPIAMKREFKRIYRDHKNLCELFELVNVPSWSAVRAGWAHQKRFYAELLDGIAELDEAERKRWKRYSVPYALAETTAQFLGARSHWKTRESRFWRWIDAKICAD